MNWLLENNAETITVHRITVLNKRRAKTFAREGGVGAASDTGEETIVQQARV